MTDYTRYPKWLYSADAEPVVVRSEAEHRGMGPDWYESPADIPAPASVVVSDPAPASDKPRRGRPRKVAP